MTKQHSIALADWIRNERLQVNGDIPMMREFSEHDMNEVCVERDQLAAQIGRQQQLAYRARRLVDQLICADGPDDLWSMVCAGLGPTILKIDDLLKAIEGSNHV